MKTLKCDVFIIPNGLREDDKYLMSSSKESIENMFGKQPDGEHFAQVWYTNDDYDNVVDHRGPIETSFMPLSVATQLTEGESLTIEVTLDGEPTLLSLTAAQSKYRYRHFGDGKFEVLLRNLLDSYTNMVA